MTALTKDEAIRLVRAAGWPVAWDKTPGECPHCGEGLGEPTRRVVHTRLGPFGADWSVEDVVAAIEHPDASVRFAGTLFGTCLVVDQADGKPLLLDDVKAPAEAIGETA